MCYWDTGETMVQEFSATEADGEGTLDPPNPWYAHCNSDSLVFWGTWPLIDSPYVGSVDYDVELSCSVSIPEATVLIASRTVVAGGLSSDRHILTIEYPSGSVIPILAEGEGPDLNQVILAPGLYVVRLNVRSSQYRYTMGVVNPYFGRVDLAWRDPRLVSVESLSWDSLKAIFRR